MSNLSSPSSWKCTSFLRSVAGHENVDGGIICCFLFIDTRVAVIYVHGSCKMFFHNKTSTSILFLPVLFLQHQASVALRFDEQGRDEQERNKQNAEYFNYVGQTLERVTHFGNHSQPSFQKMNPCLHYHVSSRKATQNSFGHLGRDLPRCPKYR